MNTFALVLLTIIVGFALGMVALFLWVILGGLDKIIEDDVRQYDNGTQASRTRAPH